MVSLLTSTFRLDNHYAIFQLFSPFLCNDGTPDVLVLVVVRTLLAITAQNPEIASLSWTPKIEKTYPLLPRALRRLFQRLLAKIRGSGPVSTGSSARLLPGKPRRESK